MKALVITSIANDKHPVLLKYANECSKRNIPFILIGDTKSPQKFQLSGCDFWDIEKQQSSNFQIAKLLPEQHYARKNLGYLIAIKNGATQIIETDDDNIPYENFWEEKLQTVLCKNISDKGWINIYHYFTENTIWPRGFPIEELIKEQPDVSNYELKNSNCPIQQGLADENPDVDAIYRITYTLPLKFEKKNTIALGKNSWSPFNSQNTNWFKDAFPLLYLPSYCNFRMTDIWRSYIAQRIAWECDWNILFHNPTVWQERNEHNLMKDFEDEITGYLNNMNICKELNNLSLKKGNENIFDNLVTCYQKMIELKMIDEKELIILNAWINDFKKIN